MVGIATPTPHCSANGSDDTSTDGSSDSIDGSSDDTSTDGSDDTGTDSGDDTGTDSGDDRASSDKATRGIDWELVPLDSEYAYQVQDWTSSIPIGLRLCPWAGQSQNQGHLRYVTCQGEKPSDVARLIATEAEGLLNGIDVAPLSTVLIVCPYVRAWEDFQVFDEWVGTGITTTEELNGKNIQDDLTFVTFHPDFLRWRGLPEGVELGSIVQSHWAVAGRKSVETSTATIIETGNKVFGMHKVRIRFHNSLGEHCRQEQYVPVDWFDHSDGSSRAPLPDNAMHRAPYPVVHLIRNFDLASLDLRTVSRVKRRNAQRAMKLGWQGMSLGKHESSCPRQQVTRHRGVLTSGFGKILSLQLESWYFAFFVFIGAFACLLAPWSPASASAAYR